MLRRVMPAAAPHLLPDQTRRARAALLVQARSARSEREIAQARRALRDWLEQFPDDVELLLADEAMTRRPALAFWR